jgi:hypothetical protein
MYLYIEHSTEVILVHLKYFLTLIIVQYLIIVVRTEYQNYARSGR